LRAPETERVWWSTDETRRFLDATRDDRLHALWRIALMCGLRRGELLRLRWSDVDLDDARTLQVQHGKTRSSRRTVSLDAGTVDALKIHRKRQLEERIATFGAYVDDDLVFCREDGTAILPHRVTLGFKRLARRHRLPIIRFHDARHSNASMLLEAGVDIRVVSERLGHASMRITHDVYQHVIRQLQDDAVERLAALVDG
jgi:integrase